MDTKKWFTKAKGCTKKNQAGTLTIPAIIFKGTHYMVISKQ